MRPNLQSKPAAWCRSLIQAPWSSPIRAYHLAARTLQQWARTWVSTDSCDDAEFSSAPNAAEVGDQSKRPKAKARENLRNRYLDLMQRQLDIRFGDTGTGSSYSSFESFCAALIQSHWRCRAHHDLNIYIQLRQWIKITYCQVAAIEIQHAWQRFQVLREQAKHLVSQTPPGETMDPKCFEATSVISRCWRRRNDRKVYLALKEHIATKERTGEPYMLLRSVCPREAQLLDFPAQVHVRFRLGGSSFPPSIYYKIFSHGNIVDINAFAPRNYARQRRTLSMAQTNPYQYQRQDNNGWRPVAQRFYRKSDELESAATAVPFVYSKPQRRRMLENKRHTRKIKWLEYFLKEREQTKVRQNEISSLEGSPIKGSTPINEDTVTIPPVVPPLNLQFDEDLISWSHKLDFDSYLESWRSLGTSENSEGLMSECAPGVSALVGVDVWSARGVKIEMD
eukprot:GEMP01044788.1.p1 GENE.GEMP01044788.1~~GEMP01044788.1.p1  ORF type:complete len:451 (+),score=100.98 GEMP01044788.1:55-1407(+)